jgi:tetratricopeptide (TPR) repeat protein
MRKKDYANGLVLANEGLAIDSLNIELRKHRAYLFYLTEQYDQALEDFNQVMVAGDSSKFTCKYYGLCFFEEKSFWDARKHLLMAYEKDTLDAETTFFLGLSYRWSQEEEEGVKYLNKTLELLQPDPRQMSRIYIELAGVYQVLHQFDMTIESYNKVLEYSDHKDLIYFRLGQVYEENLHNKKLAIEYYQKYIDLRTADHQLYNSSTETMEPLLDQVQSRINRLKEELFFEE